MTALILLYVNCVLISLFAGFLYTNRRGLCVHYCIDVVDVVVELNSIQFNSIERWFRLLVGGRLMMALSMFLGGIALFVTIVAYVMRFSKCAYSGLVAIKQNIR